MMAHGASPRQAPAMYDRQADGRKQWIFDDRVALAAVTAQDRLIAGVALLEKPALDQPRPRSDRPPRPIGHRLAIAPVRKYQTVTYAD